MVDADVLLVNVINLLYALLKTLSQQSTIAVPENITILPPINQTTTRMSTISGTTGSTILASIVPPLPSSSGGRCQPGN